MYLLRVRAIRQGNTNDCGFHQFLTAVSAGSRYKSGEDCQGITEASVNQHTPVMSLPLSPPLVYFTACFPVATPGPLIF